MITNLSTPEVMSLVGLTQNNSTVEPKIVLFLKSVQAHSEQISVEKNWNWAVHYFLD